MVFLGGVVYEMRGQKGDNISMHVYVDAKDNRSAIN